MRELPDRIDDSSLVPPDLRPDRYSMTIKDRKARILSADGTTHFVFPATA
jgi:hypothetical protein